MICSKIPGSEPGELPFIGHRNDVATKQMKPLMVPRITTLLRRQRLGRVAVQPVGHDKVVVLLRPEHSGEGLPRDQFRVRRKSVAMHSLVKGIGLFAALRNDRIEIRERRFERMITDQC